ncbi:MAG: peptidoglycan-binding protein [Ilumatobacteraceae bacterium]
MASTKRRRGRIAGTVIVCLALAGGAAVAIAKRSPKSASTVTAASIFKTAAVTRGDLTTTERIDGTVQLSSTLSVLHRIEGQTSSSASSSAPSASTQASTPASTSTPAASSNPAALSSPLVADCSSTTTPAPTVPATTTPTSVPDTTPAASPDTSPATTTTAAAPTEPPTTLGAPVPDPCAATTTTPTAPTEPAATVPAGGVGNAPAAARTNPARAASSASGSSASTARVTQTITSIIAPNAAIQQGDVLYTVDGAPVVALDGALPAWRSLSTSSTDGADVAQLEAALVALGYDPALKVTVDNHFDSATRTMVKAWQQGLGVEVTGTVKLGSVVFLPTSTTVSTVARAVGDTVGDGDTVLTLSTPTQQVLVDVPAGDESQVVPGLTVEIGTVQGTVSRLRSADRNGTVVVEAVITPATAIQNATTGTSVKVTLTLQDDAGVLIAPAEALVSRLDGTYAVQAQTADGTTKWLTVELLGVSGGSVAIRGPEVSEGTVLLLPA